MLSVSRRAALVGFFAVCVGCGDEAPPTAPSARPAAAPPPVTVEPFPPVSGGTITYSFSEPLEYRVSGFTVRSAFVLNETAGFYLAYEAFAHRYQGRYERDDGQISFYFSEQTRAAADAICTLKGNLLEVRYSERMQHSDFENGVYRRVE